MAYNVVIPCSGPGSRSSSYSKFHKALVRVKNQAVISHIIDSYPHANTIYVMLGHNGNYIREYLDHCEYPNIKYIEIENWQESQYASLRQLPLDVFKQPFYLNSCDNWTTTTPITTENTTFFCEPDNIEYYDTVDSKAFAGIGYVADPALWRDALFKLDATRNDYLIYEQLPNLQHVNLPDWYDVGNTESLKVTLSHFTDDFELLDKSHQEIYYVKDRVIKLFKKPVENLIDSLTKNLAYPHPNNIKFTERGLSYSYVDGDTNVKGQQFTALFDNQCKLWDFCITNNSTHNASEIWQIKTFERFDKMIKNYPEFSKPIIINDVVIDPIRTVELIDWQTVNQGIYGPCHGDLNLDNIIIDNNNIFYIDHRPGLVTDIFYDISKFYHSLHLNNHNLTTYNLSYSDNKYTFNIDIDDQRILVFKNSEIYKQHHKKIELGVGCVWLSMAPLNVSHDLNRFLFLYAIKHLYEVTNE